MTWLRCTRGHVSVGECHRRALAIERAAEISDKLHQLIGIHFHTGFFGQIRLMWGHLEASLCWKCFVSVPKLRAAQRSCLSSSEHFLGSASDIVYAHLERYDGTGYPRGLKGGEIPRCRLLVC